MEHSEHKAQIGIGQTGGTHTWGTRQASASGIMEKVEYSAVAEPPNLLK